ncbi:MAG: ATP-dependent DNA ligase [Candidatus Micrarchaeaceae archaeon]
MLFSELADYYDKLEAISSRLKMIEVLGELFKKLNANEIEQTIYLTQGILLPPYEGLEFGVAEKLVEEAAAMATGYTKESIEKEYKKSGDLGITIQKVKSETKLKRIVARKYTIIEVYDKMRKIAETNGEGSKDKKVNMLADLIIASTGVEVKYIVRYPLGQLRTGVGDSTILEALSIMGTGDRQFKKALERAYNICCDLGMIGKTLAEKGPKAIEKMNITLFKPVRPALAERLTTAEAIIKRLNGKTSVEQKYDGFRVQIHKDGSKVKLFSRKLENTTEMFPDLVKAVKDEVNAKNIIFEGEALAFNEATSEYMPFQETIQRKRKHNIAETAEKLPLHLFAFDVLYLNDKDMLSEPYEERRAVLEKLFNNGTLIKPTTRILTSSPKELEEFFEKSIENGLEGVIAKDLKAPYIAGSRKFSWIKLKRSYKGELSDTLDLVIVGYFLGRGSRAEFKFGGLLCASYNKKRDMFETISRIGTGFTEAQMQELNIKLSKIKLANRPARVDSIVKPDFWVDPRYVVTINADEITRSPMHTCGRSKQENGIETGYALRFPRLVGPEAIRKDKDAEDATTTQEVIELFKLQKKVSVKE